MGKPDFREGQAEKYGQNWKTVIFPGESGEIVLMLPWKDRNPLLHVLDPNFPSFYVKCPRKCQKTYNFDIFPTLSQIDTSPPPRFWGKSQIWSYAPTCILLNLDYAKFGVSNVFFSKVIEEKPLEVCSTPLVLKEGLMSIMKLLLHSYGWLWITPPF